MSKEIKNNQAPLLWVELGRSGIIMAPRLTKDENDKWKPSCGGSMKELKPATKASWRRARQKKQP